MNVSGVEAWLTRKVARESALSLLGCAGLLLASALVLLFTFWVVYCFLWFIGFQFRHWFSIPHAVRVSVGLLVLVLLFIGNARTDPEYLSEFSLTPSLAGDQAVVFYLPAVGVVSNLNPLAPDQARNAVKMIKDLSFSGPRLRHCAPRGRRNGCGKWTCRTLRKSWPFCCPRAARSASPNCFRKLGSTIRPGSS